MENPQVPQQSSTSLVVRMAQRFGVDADKMLATLKQTAFKTDEPVSNEQMMALLVVAEQYGLNPWTREIYAFPDKHRGIVPVVGVDGWSRIINTGDQFDGVEFVDGPESSDKKHGKAPEWIEAVIYRKDRAHAIRVRERMSECFRGTPPWQSHPARMLRHKALIQCARLAFGFVGIYDEDEAARIIDVGGERVVDDSPAVAAINESIAGKPADFAGQMLGKPPIEAEVVKGSGGAGVTLESEQAAPVTTFAKLTKLIQDAKDVDVLDAHADLIQYLPTDAERADASTLYRAQRAKIASA
jgi:phage recombination protein Bet